MVFSKATGELAVGDKKGVVHFHKCDDFAETAKFEGHNDQSITCMAVTADGKTIASGDKYRYTHVLDAASHEGTSKYAFQPASVVSVAFSEDGSQLAIVATDMSFGVVNLADGKHKHVKNPHMDKKPQLCAFLPDGKLATAGDDCAIRIWDVKAE